jgi:hypothetical protein
MVRYGGEPHYAYLTTLTKPGNRKEMNETEERQANAATGRRIMGIASPLGVIRAMIGDHPGEMVRVMDGKVKAAKASATPPWIRQTLSDDREQVIRALALEQSSGRVTWQDSYAAGLLDMRLASLTSDLMSWKTEEVKAAAFAINALDDQIKAIESRGGNWRPLLEDDYAKCLTLYNEAHAVGRTLTGESLLSALQDSFGEGRKDEHQAPPAQSEPKASMAQPVQAGLFEAAVNLGALD